VTARRTHPELRCLVALVAALVLSGCASTATSPAAIEGARAHRVVLIPLNVVLALPTELESSVDPVQAALVDYLQFHGKEVIGVEFRTAHSLWRRSMQEVSRSSQPNTFENAARVYVGLLHEQVPFDALVLPAIFLQNVEATSGRTLLRWDGASERVRVERTVPGSTTCGRAGRTKAASLLIKVFDAEGEQLHTAQSGLELVEHIEVRADSSRGGGWRICETVSDSPAIDQPDRVMEGIARGLSPFLPERIPEPGELETESGEADEAG
jgi:hypothetical protein